MTEGNNTYADPTTSPNLKLPEAEVSVDQPWHDDVLNREKIAERLTNLIGTQSVPFVVSVHGAWGTGKTFMLKRWQRDLQGKGFHSIYFNAWDDDYCDDPLLAIIGQLSDHFKEGFAKGLGQKIRRVAMPLIRRNAFGVLNRATGLELDIQNIEDPNRDLFEEYLDQRATKEELKRQLTELTAKVFEETGHPTVFIIDELDRCRPTFAIELLERVKHIFDVPNLVFVIGINHDELCKSLKSVYGEISADIYLRRFFDIEFTLPEADSESFCRHLFEKFELREFFASLRNGARSDVHINEFDYLSGNFPYLWGKLGLSLRDIENCVRLVALVGKNIDPQRTMYPELIGLLIPLKFANPNLYRGFVRGDSIGSEVMNYIDEKLNGGDPDGNPSNLLNVVEVFLYFSDNRFDTRGLGESQSIRQLEMLSKNQKPTPPYFLSKRTQESDPTRIMRLTHIAGNPQQRHLPPGTIGYLADLIDLHQEMLRR